MGFDPRQWPSAGRSTRPITSNIDALLAENEALRLEVQRLRRELANRGHQAPYREPSRQRRPSDAGSNTNTVWVRVEQVQRWGEALAQQRGWSRLRAGDEAAGLQGLITTINRRSFQPHLSLEQRLDHLAPGLGRDLQAAVAGPRTKKRLAVLAAFALYGLSAREWLNDDPRRVVEDLLRELDRMERSGASASRSRRTRSDQRASDRQSRDQHTRERQTQPHDPRRQEAYRVLGLRWGSSKEAVKQAHRRLVKQHHPDMGGSAEAFRRVNDAYQLLIA
jgi:hypothetical protein